MEEGEALGEGIINFAQLQVYRAFDAEGGQEMTPGAEASAGAALNAAGT